VKLARLIIHHWPIIVIILIAAILRFWRLEALTTFGGDQGYDFLIVKKILEGDLTLLGPKIGPYNQLGNLYLGPAYYYLLAPALFLFHLDPIGAAFLTVILSLCTIFLIYLISFLSGLLCLLFNSNTL
jgi:4-amino-4-deoxy-L-arabinose transferase-like glycosyltransferase